MLVEVIADFQPAASQLCAAYVLVDAGGLGVALTAIRFAERPATPQNLLHLHGVLSTLTNALAVC